MSVLPKTFRVLIADDQAINRKLTSRRLERFGFTVDAVENGEEAVAAWSRGIYDLIFMDCHMPRMDGFQATELIREREGEGPHTPIVALTASAVGAERERCITSGMNEYVLKPISDADLNRILTTYVVDSRPSVGGGSDVRREIIALYLAEAPQRMQDIRRAVDRRDSESLFHAAHALKSTAGSAGVTRVHEICGELESIGRANTAAGARKLLAQLEVEFERADRELRKPRG